MNEFLGRHRVFPAVAAMASRKNVLDGIAAAAGKRNIVVPRQLPLPSTIDAAPTKGTAEREPFGNRMKAAGSFFAGSPTYLPLKDCVGMRGRPYSAGFPVNVPVRLNVSPVGRVALGTLTVASLVFAGSLAIAQDVGPHLLRVSLFPPATRSDGAFAVLRILSEPTAPQGGVINVPTGSTSVMRGLIAKARLATSAEGHTSETTPLFLSADAEANHQRSIP